MTPNELTAVVLSSFVFHLPIRAGQSLQAFHVNARINALLDDRSLHLHPMTRLQQPSHNPYFAYLMDALRGFVLLFDKRYNPIRLSENSVPAALVESADNSYELSKHVDFFLKLRAFPAKVWSIIFHKIDENCAYAKVSGW